jgi:hypothetical protein
LIATPVPIRRALRLWRGPRAAEGRDRLWLIGLLPGREPLGAGLRLIVGQVAGGKGFPQRFAKPIDLGEVGLLDGKRKAVLEKSSCKTSATDGDATEGA